ncbi:hypothetical protein AAW51_5006 [Caldimonas brevitalea]|uniref:Uncharacterized protein n=2 Tax=Caldimonas brevitalea TaxID=413882 RepID=A0A0G3BQI0_9BURK|nr:hypothetical protein AAW51_5006 [Caldimonas brevitalea]
MFGMVGTGPHGLTRIGEAWRNGPALVTLVATFVAAALLIGLGAATGVALLMFVFGLLAWGLVLLGLAAAGRQFMDQAQGLPVTGSAAAFGGSPMAVARLLGLALVCSLVVVAWLAVAALLLFFCKIPLLGGVLLVGVVPLLVFSGALLFLGLYVTWGLAAPALFEGHTLKRALSQLWAIITDRPLEAFLRLMLLFALVGLIAALTMAFIGAGFGITAGLAASILGGDIGQMLGGPDMPQVSDSVSAGGHFGAGLGIGIVWAVVGAVFAALLLYGLCLSYLRLTADLDTTAAEAAVDTALARTREKAQQAAEDARRRAQELQAAARQRAEQVRRGAPASAAPSAESGTVPNAPSPAVVAPGGDPPLADDWESPPKGQGPAAPDDAGVGDGVQEPGAPGLLRCPSCKTVVAPTDTFCGACGRKLD